MRGAITRRIASEPSVVSGSWRRETALWRSTLTCRCEFLAVENRHMSTLAVYPGTFDPLTNGHVDIITRGARLFDRIIVAILVNAEKSPLFSMSERVEIAREVFKDRANVEIDTFNGLLVDYVERRGAQVIVRGLRAVPGFALQFHMA